MNSFLKLVIHPCYNIHFCIIVHVKFKIKKAYLLFESFKQLILSCIQLSLKICATFQFFL